MPTNLFCEFEKETEDVRPEQLFTLVLRYRAEKDIRINVTDSRLAAVISILSDSYSIEVE